MFKGEKTKSDSQKIGEVMTDQWTPTVGITLNTKKGHIARATLEATCYQTKAILDAMQLDSGHALAELAVDGGMSNSDLCMQTQADTIGIPVYRPKYVKINPGRASR